jgi:hypothetical protein
MAAACDADRTAVVVRCDLLAIGDLAATILFGSFFGYALIDLISVIAQRMLEMRRGRGKQRFHAALFPPGGWKLIALTPPRFASRSRNV